VNAASGTGPGPTAPGLARAWCMVAALFAIYVFSWLDRLAISMLVAPIKADMQLSDAQVGLVLGPAFAFAYAVFGVPMGWAADRFARRLVVFAGVLVWSAATVACGFAQSFEQLLAARVFVGIGEAALLPAAYSLIGDAFPPEKVTVATSVFQSAGKAGSAAAFGLGGLAIALATTLVWVDWPLRGQASAWQITFFLVGLPGFALAFLALSFPEPARRNRGAAGGPVKGEAAAFLKRNAGLAALITLAFTCLATIGYSMTAWVPTYMERHFGWHPARYGVALSAMNILGALALVGCGGIVDRLYRGGMQDAHLRFYTWTIAALSPAIVYAFLAGNPFAFLACYALIQLITVPFIVYGSAIIALLAPSHLRGLLIGLLMLVFTIFGAGGGPALVGWLTDHVFASEALVGRSLALVVIACAAVAWLAMRAALPRLAAAVVAASQAGQT